jgi:hypothetical protein
MNPKQRQFKPKLLPILFVLLQFFSITQAIGGWQTVCIFFNRWSEERGQSTSSSSKGPKSQEERIVPAISAVKRCQMLMMRALEAVRRRKSTSVKFLWLLEQFQTPHLAILHRGLALLHL